MFGYSIEGLVPVEGMKHHDESGNTYQVMRDKDYNLFADGKPLRAIAANDVPETLGDLEDCALLDRHHRKFRELSVAA